MSTFETEGFLSSKISQVEKTIAARYPEKFQLADDTNRLTHRVIYAIKPHNEHVPDLMLAALLIRQASSFQGFLILLGKGLETQAQILLRNLAEMMFITGAIRKDDKFVTQYVLSEDISRLKSLEAIVKDKRSRGEEIDEKTKDLIVTLREKIRSEELTSFSTERIARTAGLSSYYDTLYRFTSMAVHASPRELNTAFEVDSSGNVVSVNYEPVVEDLDMYIDYGISMMLYTLHETTSHFKIDVIPEIERLQRVNSELAGPPRQSETGA
jgi:hypothetical protein